MKQKPRYALLDTLFAAQRENKIDEHGIQEEVDTFIVAGYDTVAAAIIHSLLVLANYQDVQQKLYEHIQAALGKLFGRIIVISCFWLNIIHFYRMQQQ